ncbi:hypothetical protein [Gordonia humi]|uniref:Mce-associated membrane protein n=2 Tax=Gordonia humi TaxID=686429 RepID=A0A840F0J4_9ACTN|nr:hypothetical protein [Gordonia humi]MBB4137392.1 Mce-associated membrane protein [Gordonia humi]
MSDSTTAPKGADHDAAGVGVLDKPATTALAEEAVDLAGSKRSRRGATTSVSATAADDSAPEAKTSSVTGRTISVKVIASAVAGLVVVAALAVLIWLVVSKSSEVDDLKAANAADAHAEQIALDYAAGAADMSYEDTQGWLTRLTANTTPELGTRLRNAASQMEQLLRPLQWSSTSSPIAAKVTSVDGDVYKVDAFVGILTKNVQAPADGIETTATYKLTIDRGQDWKITAITSNGTSLDADGAQTEAPQSDAQQTEAPQTPAPVAPGAPTAGQDAPAAPGN